MRLKVSSLIGFGILLIIVGAIIFFLYQGRIDERLYFLPTQSFKVTSTNFANITVPIVAKNNTIKDVKFLNIETDNKERIAVQTTEILDEQQINSQQKIYVVMLKFFLNASDNNEKTYKLEKVYYSYKDKEEIGKIDVIYEIEHSNESPLLIGPFEVRDAQNDIIFDLINDSEQNVIITDINCGPEIKVQERKLIDSKNNELDIRNNLVIKPKETVKQRIKFQRNTDALSEIHLKIYISKDKMQKWINLFGIAYPGMNDKEKIKFYIDSMK